MKQLSFLLLLLYLTANNSLIAQNTISSAGKQPVYTNPPGVFLQPKGDAHIQTEYLKPDTAGNNVRLINGSFELNSGQCIINGHNNVITANVVATTAYGCANEIDLMNNTCGYGQALSGNYFLCLSNGLGNCGDACNLELNKKLVAGAVYSISYFDRGYSKNGCCPPGVALEVGISTLANKQGKIVYISPAPSTNVWSQRIFTFVAPNNGRYISFRAKDSAGRWTHIDSVSIIASACKPPNNLTVSNVQSTAVKLSWNLPITQVSYFKLFYWEKGSSEKLLKRKGSSVTEFRLPGLTPNTTYEWEMKSVCDSNKSMIALGPEFTTLPSGSFVNGIKIFPNPVKNNLQIDGLSATGKTKLSVVDFMGNVIMVSAVTGESASLNVSALNKGNYLLKIEINNTIVSGWFVKQ